MFVDDRKEKTETFLKINDADLIAVKALVKYIYTGVIILTKDNVEQMLCTSDLFQIEWVKKQCIRFLKQSLNSTNCFRIRKFAGMVIMKFPGICSAYICKCLLSFQISSPAENSTISVTNTLWSISMTYLSRRTCYYCPSNRYATE